MVVLWALQSSGIDKVIVVPTFRHAFGKSFGATFPQRMEMCRLALEPLPKERVILSNIEEERGGTSYMIETVRAFQQVYKDTTFRLIVGSDLIPEIPTWFQGAELMQLAPPLEVPRPIPGEVPKPGMLPLISSSEVRQRLATGQDVSQLLPAFVEAYIAKHQLYHARA